MAQQENLESVETSFLDLARAAASTVGRIVHRKLGWLGTGFMISDNLFLTNNHVILDSSWANEILVEFNYELDVFGVLKPVSKFSMAPNIFFMSNSKEDLDFTISAIGNRVSGEDKLSDFGYCPMTDANDLANCEWVNIIHHPRGHFKQMIIRENRIVARNPEVLQYSAATDTGSSGAPVFNDKWEPIALHHWGMPTKEAFTREGKKGSDDLKEGIRISAILNKINSKKDCLSSDQRALIESALSSSFSCPSLARPV